MVTVTSTGEKVNSVGELAMVGEVFRGKETFCSPIKGQKPCRRAHTNKREFRTDSDIQRSDRSPGERGKRKPEGGTVLSVLFVFLGLLRSRADRRNRELGRSCRKQVEGTTEYTEDTESSYRKSGKGGMRDRKS